MKSCCEQASTPPPKGPALSSEASREVYGLLFARLGRVALGSDLEAFYEALFVVKQIARGADDALNPHFDVLVEWMRTAIDLPAGLRGRISAGNVASLLMTLAASAAAGDQRHVIAELAVIAKLRHRVDAPTSLQRPSVQPPSSPPPPLPPPPRRSVPPPLPHQRPRMVPLADDDDAPMPLSSKDLLPELELMTLETPAFAFKPVVLPAPAPMPVVQVAVAIAVEAEAAPSAEPTLKRPRKAKKAEAKKRGSRSRKKPPGE